MDIANCAGPAFKLPGLATCIPSFSWRSACALRARAAPCVGGRRLTNGRSLCTLRHVSPNYGSLVRSPATSLAMRVVRSRSGFVSASVLHSALTHGVRLPYRGGWKAHAGRSGSGRTSKRGSRWDQPGAARRAGRRSDCPAALSRKCRTKAPLGWLRPTSRPHKGPNMLEVVQTCAFARLEHPTPAQTHGTGLHSCSDTCIRALLSTYGASPCWHGLCPCSRCLPAATCALRRSASCISGCISGHLPASRRQTPPPAGEKG